MAITYGSNKIQDTRTPGVYYGGQAIKAIYCGSELVYQYSSYESGTILLNEATAGTYTVPLKKGRYFISLTGAGGRASGGYYYACFQNSGGSGGTVKGDFYVIQETEVTVVVGAGQDGTGQVSTLSVGGTVMMIANGGNACHANGQCGGNTGGSASFNLSGVLTNKTLQAVTGNAGSYSTDWARGGSSNDAVDTERGRGAHSSACTAVYGQPGGVQIKYLSMKK